MISYDYDKLSAFKRLIDDHSSSYGAKHAGNL